MKWVMLSPAQHRALLELAEASWTLGELDGQYGAGVSRRYLEAYAAVEKLRKSSAVYKAMIQLRTATNARGGRVYFMLTPAAARALLHALDRSEAFWQDGSRGVRHVDWLRRRLRALL